MTWKFDFFTFVNLKITYLFRTPIINHGSGPPSDLPMLTHDKKTAENTALAVIADAGSDYPFDSGLYLYPDEPNLDYDLVEDYKNMSRNVVNTGTYLILTLYVENFNKILNYANKIL